MTAKQIKESLSIDRSNTSFRLRKLEALGYVMRDGTVSGTKTIRWTWIDGK
jgi:predicted transcriptional regulator